MPIFLCHACSEFSWIRISDHLLNQSETTVINTCPGSTLGRGHSCLAAHGGPSCSWKPKMCRAIEKNPKTDEIQDIPGFRLSTTTPPVSKTKYNSTTTSEFSGHRSLRYFAVKPLHDFQLKVSSPRFREILGRGHRGLERASGRC